MDSLKKVWSYDDEKDKTLKAGTLLLAEPFMDDPNFKRSVVLIARHDELGTHGFILNSPLDVKVNDLVANFPLGFAGKVLWGGPMGTDVMQTLHNQGLLLPDSQTISEGVFWGGDLEQLKKHIRQQKLIPQHIRFIVGYAGWEPGQLADEIKEGSWILAEGANNALFYTSPKTMWSAILENMGGIYKEMAKYPENPQLN